MQIFNMKHTNDKTPLDACTFSARGTPSLWPISRFET